MSTVSKTMTFEEFYEWVHSSENEHGHFELVRGEVVEISPPGKYHGFVCASIAGILGNFAIARGSGYVCTNSAGVIIEREPDTVRGPDVTFYEETQTSDDMERQYAIDPPILAVDVLSPNDRTNVTTIRVSQLLNHDVKMIWIVDPEAKDVCVYQQGEDPRLLKDKDCLTGGDILPDFECSVAELFAVPGK